MNELQNVTSFDYVMIWLCKTKKPSVSLQLSRCGFSTPPIVSNS